MAGAGLSRAAPAASAPPPGAGRPGAAEAISATVVRSPMVGTFYRASPARAQSRWSRRRRSTGPALFIIEAMKIMNEIGPTSRRHRDEMLARTASRSSRTAAVHHRITGLPAMFKKILIANRGEIALRILRACRGWASRWSSIPRPTATPHVKLADEAGASARRRRRRATSTCRPSSPRRRSDRRRGHPPRLRFPVGERRLRRSAWKASGFIFIGPTAGTIRMMGDKVSAKRDDQVRRAPACPAPAACCRTTRGDHPHRAAIGYPVIIKAAGGGGGAACAWCTPGRADLRRCRPDAPRPVQRSSTATCLHGEVPRNPRHVEIQVLADGHGNAIWLGDATARCSAATRRSSKSPGARASRPADRRSATAAPRPAVKIGYRGAAPSSSCTRTASSISSR